MKNKKQINKTRLPLLIIILVAEAILFNSANGSQFSGTIGTIQQLEPEAKVITDGLSVHQNRVSGAQSEVEDWLKRLGF